MREYFEGGAVSDKPAQARKQRSAIERSAVVEPMRTSRFVRIADIAVRGRNEFLQFAAAPAVDAHVPRQGIAGRHQTLERDHRAEAVADNVPAVVFLHRHIDEAIGKAALNAGAAGLPEIGQRGAVLALALLIHLHRAHIGKDGAEHVDAPETGDERNEADQHPRRQEQQEEQVGPPEDAVSRREGDAIPCRCCD